MKTLILITSSILIFFMASCSDNPVHQDSYVRGELFIGFEKTVPLDSVYSLVKMFDLKISEIYSYDYVINTSQDSMSYYENLIESKPYISNASVTFNGKNVIASLWFKSFTADEAANWFDFKMKGPYSQITDTEIVQARALINVPSGQETEWIGVLTQSHLISFADYNHEFIIGK